MHVWYHPLVHCFGKSSGDILFTRSWSLPRMFNESPSECDQDERDWQVGEVWLRSVWGEVRGGEAGEAGQPCHRWRGLHQNFPHGQKLVPVSCWSNCQPWSRAHLDLQQWSDFLCVPSVSILACHYIEPHSWTIYRYRFRTATDICVKTRVG